MIVKKTPLRRNTLVSSKKYYTPWKIVSLVICALFVLGIPALLTAQKISRPASAEPPAPVVRKKNEREEEREKKSKRAHPRAQQKDTSVPQVGTPWVGEHGVTRTSDDIMREAASRPSIDKSKFRMMAEHELPDRTNLPQDPNSPQVSSYADSKFAPPASKVRSPLPDVVSPAPLAPQTTSTSFTGATLADTGAFPPDSMGAIGPTQYVVFVNGRLRTFNKTTGVADGVINADPDAFFSSVMTPMPPPGLNFTSDPQVRYDRLSGRWIMMIIDVPSSSSSTIGDTPNRILIAVSDAASAGTISAGTVWTFYFVQQNTVGGPSTGEFLDYESMGVDNNALYVGGNMFSAATGAFVTTSAFVIRKSSILSGGPVVTTAFRNLISGGEGLRTPRGVDNYDPAATEGYFIGPSNIAFGRLVMRRITDPGGTPTISANILITVPTTASPITVDHLGKTGGNNGNLDALDDRLFVPQIRGGRLWTAHTIAVTAGGIGSGSNPQRRDAVRWYELNVPVGVGTPTVVQSGTIFDTQGNVTASRQYWIPSVGISGQGHAAIGFSTAGTPFNIDAATSGRLSGDALGTTGAVANYTASSTAYNPPSDPGGSGGRRWGDYSYTSVDPLDDMTMWTIQEFCNAANSYGVRVVKLLAPLPATPATASPASVAAGQPSVNVTITGTAVSGSGFFDPGANLAPPALPFNHIGATVGGGVTVNSVTYNSPTQVTLNISTVGASVGAQTVTVTNPDGQSTASASGILAISPATTISGQVTDGVNPLSGVTISYTGTTSGTTTTSAGGNYSFNVTSGGNYTVTPSGLGRKYTPSSASFTNVTTNQTANFVGTAIGAGDLIISEFRLSGPNGTNDEFVEIYNNTNTVITISTSDASAGFSV
ncbi:MAG: hypothetical protein QOH96_3194, partial [Blastocatellia bacterium]|nr:hypothetical protein [Blastocatellia bacterium]